MSDLVKELQAHSAYGGDLYDRAKSRIEALEAGLRHMAAQKRNAAWDEGTFVEYAEALLAGEDTSFWENFGA